VAEDVSVGNLVTNLVGDGDVFLKNIEAAIGRIDALNLRVQSVGASIANVNKTAAPAQPMQQQVGAVANVAAHQLVAATASANAAKSAAVQLTYEEKVNKEIERRIALVKLNRDVQKGLREEGEPGEQGTGHLPARLIAHIASHAAESAGLPGVGGETLLFTHLLEYGGIFAGVTVAALAVAAGVAHIYEEHKKATLALIDYNNELKKSAATAQITAHAGVMGDYGAQLESSMGENLQKAQDIADAYNKSRFEMSMMGDLGEKLDDWWSEGISYLSQQLGIQYQLNSANQEALGLVQQQIVNEMDLALIKKQQAGLAAYNQDDLDKRQLRSSVAGSAVDAMHSGPARERAEVEQKIKQDRLALDKKQIAESEKQETDQRLALATAMQQYRSGNMSQSELKDLGANQLKDKIKLTSKHEDQDAAADKEAANQRIAEQVREQDALIQHQNSYQQARVEAATSGTGREISLIHERLNEDLAAAQREGQSAQTVALIKAEAAEKEKAVLAGIQDKTAEQQVSLEQAQHKISDLAAAYQKIAIQNQGAPPGVIAALQQQAQIQEQIKNAGLADSIKDQNIALAEAEHRITAYDAALLKLANDNQGASQATMDLLRQQAQIQEQVWGANFARQQLESIHNLRGMNMQLEDYKRDLDRAVESGQLSLDQAKELYKQKQWDIGLTKPVDTGTFQSSGGAAGRMANIDYRYLHPMFTPQAYKEYSGPGAAPGPGGPHIPGSVPGSLPSGGSKDPNTDILAAMLKLWERYLGKDPLH
jgi:hypothetical protein